jgi:hypothetical protein
MAVAPAREGDGEPAPRPHASRLWAVVFWVSAVATALPLFATRYLPLTDVPEHVAVITTLERLMPGGSGAPYEVALGHSQYLLYHAVGAVIARVVGDAVLANRLLLAAVAVLWPVATRSLLRAMGRDERLAIFAAMVFWNRATIVGLEPYVASVPLALFALALVVRQTREGTWRRALTIGALGLAAFYTHVSSYVLFASTATALVFAMVVRERRDLARLRAALRRGAAALAALVPSALAAVVWWHAGSLADAGAQPGGVDRMPIAESLGAMPIWTFDVWRSRVDEVCAAAWWSAYALVVVASWRKKAREHGRQHAPGAWLLWVPFACAAAVYLTTPFRVGGAAMLNVRLAPVLTLFALLWLDLRRDRYGATALAVAACAALVSAGNGIREVRRVAREKIGDLDVVLGAMKPGTRVAMLNFERSSPRTHFWPYIFAGSYHRARGGAAASYSFAELPHWPVHYARGSAPPDHGPFWAFRPCAYRYREDGAFYDYVLVQGDVDVFDGRQGTLGPLFVPIARAGLFVLYEKVDGPPRPAASPSLSPSPAPSPPESSAAPPDHGPCRARTAVPSP